MRHRSFISLAVALGVLLCGSVAVYAYDSSRDDLIADGVRVAGIDVGGMRAGEARRTLEREVGAPLERSVIVDYHGRQFRLSARQARITADVGGMVAEAIDKSRDGNLITRTARGLTGGDVDADVDPKVTYSQVAVDGLVKRVARALNQPAQDAHVEPSGGGINQVPGRNGVAVRTGALREDIAAELVQPEGDRAVKVRTKLTKPKVTTGQLADRYPQFITISREGFQLRFYKRLRLAKKYTIAVGQVGFDTPAGLYHVQNKGVNVAWSVPNSAWAGKLAGKVIPGGSPENPIKARWMGIFNGAGIHGTDSVGSLGHAASHGCIRMAIPDVIELYPHVPVGTPVYIG
jgi:lipoprotein-anchoring transpeptidase ErfK/SrfK